MTIIHYSLSPFLSISLSFAKTPVFSRFKNYANAELLFDMLTCIQQSLLPLLLMLSILQKENTHAQRDTQYFLEVLVPQLTQHHTTRLQHFTVLPNFTGTSETWPNLRFNSKARHQEDWLEYEQPTSIILPSLVLNLPRNLTCPPCKFLTPMSTQSIVPTWNTTH